LGDKPGEEREDIRKRISRFDDEIHSCLSLGASKRLISTSEKFIFLNRKDVNPVRKEIGHRLNADFSRY
jgi:hypothetical protein